MKRILCPTLLSLVLFSSLAHALSPSSVCLRKSGTIVSRRRCAQGEERLTVKLLQSLISSGTTVLRKEPDAVETTVRGRVAEFPPQCAEAHPRVHELLGDPAIAAQVDIPGQSIVAYTDSSGRFSLLHVPPGTQHLRVGNTIRRVSVSAGVENVVDAFFLHADCCGNGVEESPEECESFPTKDLGEVLMVHGQRIKDCTDLGFPPDSFLASPVCTACKLDASPCAN